MNNPKILIVEDELALAKVLNDYLLHHHYSTELVSDGAVTLAVFEQYQPDLVILDLMLPNRDGLDICRAIRRSSPVPVIITTARVEEIDRLLGLELGADDYICKPYSPREVVARVKAVLRRANVSPATSRATALALDEKAMSASLWGKVLELTAVEFRLLESMVNEPRRIFTRNQLMDRIYTDQRVVSDRTIDSHITKLRKKLAAVNGGADIIRSVYGAGYKYEEPESLVAGGSV